MPGIRGLMAFRPETAKPLNELVEVLLQGASRLSKGERELIAAYVSGLNECKFCAGTHGAIAKHHFGDSKPVEEVKINPESGLFSPKLRSLLAIAAKVQKGGLYVTNTDVEIAREYGAQIWKFTIPYLSRLLFACLTAMWTALVQRLRQRKRYMTRSVRIVQKTGISCQTTKSFKTEP